MSRFRFRRDFFMIKNLSLLLWFIRGKNLCFNSIKCIQLNRVRASSIKQTFNFTLSIHRKSTSRFFSVPFHSIYERELDVIIQSSKATILVHIHRHTHRRSWLHTQHQRDSFYRKFVRFLCGVNCVGNSLCDTRGKATIIIKNTWMHCTHWLWRCQKFENY